MAIILLDPINLQGKSGTLIFSNRILYGKLGVNANSSITGLVIKVVKSGSNSNGVADVSPVMYRIIKYVKSIPVGRASVQSKSHKYKTVKGDLVSHSKLETYVYDRDIRESMLGYLPQYYQDFRDIRSLIVSEANEFTRLNSKLEELFMQFFIGSASYSLDDWEKFANVKQRGQSSSIRRDEVKKKLEGLGTVTPTVLKGIVDSFYKSEMEELPEPGIIKFKITGTRGEPDNIADIEEAVNEVIPGHLETDFSFSYLPWSEVDAARLRWSQANEYSYKGLEGAYLL